MPKYSAKINKSGSGSYIPVYIEADSFSDANELLKIQYPGYDIYFLDEETFRTDSVSRTGQTPVEQRSTSTGRRGCLNVVGSIILAGIVLIGFYFWEKSASSPGETALDPSLQPMIASENLSVSESSAPATSTDKDLLQDGAVENEIERSPVETDSSLDEERSAVESENPSATRLRNFSASVIEADGARQTISLSALDEADARRIIRDFRGNPEIVDIHPEP